MPKSFDKCVKDGGKIRTRKPSKNKFQRVCILGKKLFPGEIKTKKK